MPKAGETIPTLTLADDRKVLVLRNRYDDTRFNIDYKTIVDHRDSKQKKQAVFECVRPGEPARHILKFVSCEPVKHALENYKKLYWQRQWLLESQDYTPYVVTGRKPLFLRIFRFTDAFWFYF